MNIIMIIGELISQQQLDAAVVFVFFHFFQLPIDEGHWEVLELPHCAKNRLVPLIA